MVRGAVGIMIKTLSFWAFLFHLFFIFLEFIEIMTKNDNVFYHYSNSTTNHAMKLTPACSLTLSLSVDAEMSEVFGVLKKLAAQALLLRHQNF